MSESIYLNTIPRYTRFYRLTPSEVDVLEALKEGESRKGYASRTYRSKRTVDFHLANIYRKMNVNDSVTGECKLVIAVIKALRAGIVKL